MIVPGRCVAVETPTQHNHFAMSHRLSVVLKNVYRYLLPTEHSAEIGDDPMEQVWTRELANMLVGTLDERVDEYDLLRIRCPVGAVACDFRITYNPRENYHSRRSGVYASMYTDNLRLYPSGLVELDARGTLDDTRYYFILHIINYSADEYRYYEHDDLRDDDVGTRVSTVDRDQILLRYTDYGARLLTLAAAQRRTSATRRLRLPNEVLLMVFTDFIFSDYGV